jgi:hypothetical protein
LRLRRVSSAQRFLTWSARFCRFCRPS